MHQLRKGASIGVAAVATTIQTERGICLAAHARKETNGRQYRPLAMLESWVAGKPDEKNICVYRYAHRPYQ